MSKTTYKFYVPRPTYMSIGAIIGYVIAISLICIIVAKVYTRNQMRQQHRQHEAESMVQNLKILEQENLISGQQKLILKNELDIKSKELSSIALKADFKNQVIDNLRQTISDKHKKESLIQKR